MIAAAAIVGLSIGLGLWIFQKNFRRAPSDETNANAAQSIDKQRENRAIEIGDSSERDKNRLGDKLAEAALDLREDRRDLAAEALREAEIIAREYEANDRDLAKRELSFVGDIKRAAAEVEAGKIEIAAETITDLLDRLNLPIN